MKTVKIKEDFFYRLVNRDKFQGDGQYTGEEFREKYLADLDDDKKWKNDDTEITLDFEGVEKIGPSFANEVFAHFTKYTPDKNLILKKIHIINISKVKLSIINEEIESGYTK